MFPSGGRTGVSVSGVKITTISPDEKKEQTKKFEQLKETLNQYSDYDAMQKQLAKEETPHPLQYYALALAWLPKLSEKLKNYQREITEESGDITKIKEEVAGEKKIFLEILQRVTPTFISANTIPFQTSGLNLVEENEKYRKEAFTLKDLFETLNNLLSKNESSSDAASTISQSRSFN